jgi:hypothetical protein
MLKNGAFRITFARVCLPQFAQKTGSYEGNFGELRLSTEISTNGAKIRQFARVYQTNVLTGKTR